MKFAYSSAPVRFKKGLKTDLVEKQNLAVSTRSLIYPLLYLHIDTKYKHEFILGNAGA